jgi:hypothetical protein
MTSVGAPDLDGEGVLSAFRRGVRDFFPPPELLATLTEPVQEEA